MSPTNDDAPFLSADGEPVSPSPAATFPGNRNTAGDVAAKWLAGMRRAKKQCVMPPWEEAVWFELPSVNSIRSHSNSEVVQLCAANGRRVGLIMSADLRADWQVTPQVNPAFDNQVDAGLHLHAGYPLLLTQSEWGPLVQCAWLGSLAPFLVPWYSPGRCVVIELVLRDWPRQT